MHTPCDNRLPITRALLGDDIADLVDQMLAPFGGSAIDPPPRRAPRPLQSRWLQQPAVLDLW